MKLPLLFIALLVAASSDQINGEHLRLRANRHMPSSVSSSSSEEKPLDASSGTSLDTSSGTSADTSAYDSLDTSTLKSHPKKHGHHGEHSHSGNFHPWKQFKKSRKKGSKKGPGRHSGKKGSKKHSRREHHHWESSSSSSSADTAVEAVKLELIDAEPELAVEPTEEFGMVSSETSFAKTAAFLLGSTMQKPHWERTEKNHGN
jgi:hypothetical protein